MQLIKFCDPEHNIYVHSGAKLQVGTLYGYRSIEDPELQDEAEGKYEFTIDFPEEIKLDQRWTNLLLQGAMGFGKAHDTPRFPGSFSVAIEKMHVVKHEGDDVVVKDTVVRISRSVNNCLIFCMSLLDTAEAKPFQKYKDHWAFPEQKANEFSQRLGRLIFQQAKICLFDDSISEFHSPSTVATLSLQGQHKKVMYRERHMRITEHSRPTYEDLLETLSNIAFVKPVRFSPEAEYRFVYELNDGQRIFAPKRNLLLTLNPLIDL